MTDSGYITRDLVAPVGTVGHLALLDDTYDVLLDGFDPGDVAPREQLVSSPFVSGSWDVAGDTLDDVLMVVSFEVAGVDEATLQTNVGVLITALRQRTFELHLTLDGTEWAWQCRRARLAVSFDANHTIGRLAGITAQMGRHPIPLVGPF